jgi:hypothetical protein
MAVPLQDACKVGAQTLSAGIAADKEPAMNSRPAVQASRHIAAVAFGITLAFALASPAAAAPLRIPFAGVFYPCGGTSGEEFSAGNVFHFRSAENYNLWATGNPLLDGPEVNTVNGDINLQTGRGVAHPRTTVFPVAVDGTWDIQITVTVGVEGLTAHGVGHGTGDLHGMTIFFSNPGAIEIDPEDNPCSDLPFAVLIEGEILAPRGTP